jgi:hypothetical protein
MRTVVQQVFSDLEEMHPNLFNVYTTEGKEFINHFHKYLAIEREQIIEAFNQGNIHEGNFFDRVNITSEQYYNETFNPETNETL